MKAMVLHKIASIDSSPLVCEELRDPRPGPGEIRIKVSCCAICRTDLHVIEGDLPRATLPIIPGHQIVGVVDQHGGEDCAQATETRAHCQTPLPAGERSGEGQNVRTTRPSPGPSLAREGGEGNASSCLHVGQRVGVAWLRHTCGACVFCKAGQENLCESSRYTGYHEHGGYAEYALVPEAFAYEIPDGFDDASAAPLLCAGIIGYSALRRCNLSRGGTLGLYGFGSSAHVVLQIAKHRGSEVYVVSRGANHREHALRLGAKWAGATAAEMPVKVDSAIIFAPAGPLVPQALTALRKGGTLALAGIYMSDIPAMDYERHVFYERDIHSVTANTREDGRALLAEAAAAGVRPDVTTYALADANRALQDLKGDRISGTGVLVM